MRFLLDSNAIVAILKGNPKLHARLRLHEPRDFGIPAVVAHELYYGAFKSQRIAQNLARVEALQFEVVHFDRDDARVSGELRATLAASGSPIGPYDVLIAGQALARSLSIVTRNTREFRRIPGLHAEDWE
ncbi:MAG: type II toxin-antitoxin system VapC family toxin [Candidatus Eremiobacteraeota bacterium]|nr:type II toxin-antitoxin system VapC family toxin [Candidatus Eremiobacteraeota bacterium]